MYDNNKQHCAPHAHRKFSHSTFAHAEGDYHDTNIAWNAGRNTRQNRQATIAGEFETPVLT